MNVEPVIQPLPKPAKVECSVLDEEEEENFDDGVDETPIATPSKRRSEDSDDGDFCDSERHNLLVTQFTPKNRKIAESVTTKMKSVANFPKVHTRPGLNISPNRKMISHFTQQPSVLSSRKPSS